MTTKQHKVKVRLGRHKVDLNVIEPDPEERIVLIGGPKDYTGHSTKVRCDSCGETVFHSAASPKGMVVLCIECAGGVRHLLRGGMSITKSQIDELRSLGVEAEEYDDDTN